MASASIPAAPINSVASALNFGNCRIVISAGAFTTLEYTAMRYILEFVLPQLRRRLRGTGKCSLHIGFGEQVFTQSLQSRNRIAEH